MGNEIRKEYSASLLAFATNTRRMSMAMLVFGESSLRKRVNILKIKKTGKWIGLVGVIFVLLIGTACFFISDIGETFMDVTTEVKDGGEAKDISAGTTIETTDTKQNENMPEEMEYFLVKADVTGDGIEDEIKIKYSSQVISPATEEEVNVVEVVSGATGKVVYSMGNYEDINLVHMGYNSLYLYYGEDQDYLLNWHPVMYQGIADYRYEIFTVNKLGQKNVMEKGEYSFELNNMKESDIQEYKDFIEKVNKRLAKSDVLISTINGELITYQDSLNHRLLFDASEDLESMGNMSEQ